jgi:hypothetical protein
MLPLETEENGRLSVGKTLVARALGSIGSAEYRHLYIMRPPDEDEDVIYDGDLACAYYASTPYHSFGMLKALHTTVSGIEEELLLKEGPWIKIPEAIPGAIVFWETKIGNDGKQHRHVGICVSETEAVHHDAVTKSPKLDRIDDLRHHSGELRLVEAIYAHVRVLEE